MVPITNYTRKGEFKWTKATSKAFNKIKERTASPPILRLLDFEKIFEVSCDASRVGIGGVLSQKGRSIVYFRKKLNEVKMKCSTYDTELYATMQALRY